MSHPLPPPPLGPPVPPPPRARAGLVVALVALAVAGLAGIGVAAFVLADRMLDDEPGRAGGGTSRSATPTPTPTPSEPATPTGTPGDDLTAPYAPSDDTDDDVHGDVEVADFPGDWNFRLGDVEHHARLVRSVDHATCGPVEKDAVLTRQRCEHAAQWVFTALDGKVRITHLFLVFDTERHAKAAQSALRSTDLDLSAGSSFPSAVEGRWHSSVYGNIVAVTVGTSRTKVDERRLTSMVNYLNADFRAALLFDF